MVKLFHKLSFSRKDGTKYSKMNLVKFVETSFKKFEVIWSPLSHINIAIHFTLFAFFQYPLKTSKNLFSDVFRR